MSIELDTTECFPEVHCEAVGRKEKWKFTYIGLPFLPRMSFCTAECMILFMCNSRRGDTNYTDSS